DNTDVPADDDKACTAETCTSGVPGHPALPLDTPCTQNGGAFCDGSGSCVQCNDVSQCTAGNACQTRLCTVAGACGFAPVAKGPWVGNPTHNDCKSDQCDGNGGIPADAPDDTDVPVDDGNQCTLDNCKAGAPDHPPVPAGTPCSQMSGSACDGNGAC